MGTVAKASNSAPSEPAPAGNQLAICVGVIDLGTQFSAYYNEWKPKIMLQWELADEMMADGRPFMVNQRYSLSLHERSALRKILQSWRGRPFTDEEAAGFDVKGVLGAPCFLTITHAKSTQGDGVFANVDSVNLLPKRVDPPKPVNPLRHYSLEDGEPEKAGLPEWICKVIRKSREFGGAAPTNGYQAGPSAAAVAAQKADLERDPAPF
jgi:hypothetical protein